MTNLDRLKTITLTVGQWTDVMYVLGDYIERKANWLEDHGIDPEAPLENDDKDFEIDVANCAAAIVFFDHLNENVPKED